jgi:ABC-type amino acid transport system permease subunit
MLYTIVSCLLEVIAASPQLYHLFAARTGLPLLQTCNAHELFDVLVLLAQARVLLTLAGGACLLEAFRATGRTHFEHFVLLQYVRLTV